MSLLTYSLSAAEKGSGLFSGGKGNYCLTLALVIRSEASDKFTPVQATLLFFRVPLLLDLDQNLSSL